MNINSEKEKYRLWAKGLRQKLDLEKVSFGIESKLKMLDEYKSAKTVMSYLAKDIEVSLNGLFKDKTKEWFLPVVKYYSEEQEQRRMTQIVVVPYIPDKTKLVKNKFNILEPEIINNNFLNQLEKKMKIDLIFVPGLCFDKAGNRIGFGKGFYDQFLKLNPYSFKIGCCPKECLVDKLPQDDWDTKVDLTVTD